MMNQQDFLREAMDTSGVLTRTERPFGSACLRGREGLTMSVRCECARYLPLVGR